MKTVNLGKTIDDWISAKIGTGLYNNASEVLREACRTQIKLDQAQESPALDQLMIECARQPARPPRPSDWQKVEQRLRNSVRRAA
jgi:putative addiction module CopG family antidote